MTKRKQGKKEVSGNVVLPPKPECYGYFMNPIYGYKQCSICPYQMECYSRWKELGEPSRKIKRVCPVKWEGRCKECEGI